MSAPRPDRRHSRSAAWKRWLPTAGIAAIVIYCLAPFYWMVVTAFRRPSDQFDNFPVPRVWSFESFLAVFEPGTGFGRALLNSLVVAGCTTLLTLVVGVSAAYALARLEFRGKSLVLALIIACSMFPGISLVVPLLGLFTELGWINSYQSMIAPSMSFALPLAVWNLTTFFRQMPVELEQAAMIDGCTPAQAFRRVIVPLAAPGVFTTAILTFIMSWNEFIIALSVVNEQDMQTVTVAISKFTGAQGFEQPFGTQMAAGVVVTVPLVVAVLLFQRRIVAGLTAGGVK
ncbi:carbohydrate ABC transporter membrane protein 2 (CUT1 family) [Saccharopolyspora erythraea NRRL 2338]|uniref:ABC sugar transporter, permease component n=2 Tax=Saccharopolyspora erythraea TaxID=1836 RepID=A4FHK0_SACEN|nr:carbohydrate ABC transporter permease [Saccharopolyspora erythraea]EQD82309.1 sugar ABC transporter permease [Saccharopolyspora erythraea D]PFG97217.1 carbohydrate ABC transporter membrane protein 2 (CUT1 family) [Saccharopolyspora erythraea NRRL 2338]QRK87414.1 carbohydrate ABC transporter permease [Saccharopolyspora erythraea]CAM03525.1 ABC sugar transporter, permease component [Saccharopolyspora erythraea NRRL 2338]